MLDSNKLNLKIEKKVIKVLKWNIVVMNGIKRNALCILEEEAIVGSTNLVKEQIDRTWRWDLRLGHVSERGLNELNKQDLLCGDNIGELKLFEDCVLGKSCRVKLKPSTTKSNQILDYIHSDLWGPSRVKSMGGARFLFSIIDDYPGKFGSPHSQEKLRCFKPLRIGK